jgi:hypothetical protein
MSEPAVKPCPRCEKLEETLHRLADPANWLLGDLFDSWTGTRDPDNYEHAYLLAADALDEAKQ